MTNPSPSATETAGHLRFFLDFINHKFGWFLPSWSDLLKLIDHVAPQPIYASWLCRPRYFLPNIKTLPIDAGFNLDPDLIDSPPSSLIIDHLAGNPANLDKILAHKPFLIEDISLALGSKYQTKNLGSFAHLTVFQLGPNINLYFKPPKIKPVSFAQTLFHPIKYPVLITTKRFNLKEQISLYLKNQSISLAPPNRLLGYLKRVGQFIQNYPDYLNTNQIITRQLYRRYKKDYSLPAILPKAQPFFTFLPFLPPDLTE
ncbi:MAG: hypothetical protein GXP43_00245 [bacterium]|nr:hypothetical protein [bacterium]